MAKILVINGPNLDILGKREEKIYGNVTIDEINSGLLKKAASRGFEIEFYQSNHEGDIVEKITRSEVDAIIINPAAYTHTSVAIRDALSARALPAVEVHISNIYAREEFRHK
ncbi:MAG TPA: type II 3-dehydroquinate dehydratase, partial [Candidatus Omnitrophota bacterium]|nr:type II 3-dehydroquinate dehydratase [Candidatus Omnitrophota bacterium]